MTKIQEVGYNEKIVEKNRKILQFLEEMRDCCQPLFSDPLTARSEDFWAGEEYGYFPYYCLSLVCKQTRVGRLFRRPKKIVLVRVSPLRSVDESPPKFEVREPKLLNYLQKNLKRWGEKSGFGYITLENKTGVAG